MIEIGKLNQLLVVKKVDFGVYLSAEEDEQDILLPMRYVPDGCQVGQTLSVFVYLDSDDMPIATTETPKASVGECAYLKVAEVNRVGAFVDWGLPKQVLVPFGEQQQPMQIGKSYVVYLYLDPASERITASSKLDKFLADTTLYYKQQQAVDLLICGRTALGYRAVVDHAFIGLLFHSDVVEPIHIGQRRKGFIKQVRPDNKVDLCLQLVSREALDQLSEQILAFIKQQDGHITLTDSSSPEQIRQQFGVSKSSYKKALGKLYKKRLIVIEKTHISLAT